MTFDDLRCEKVEAVKLSQNMKDIANEFYKEMLKEHKGKDNIISAEKLAANISVETGHRCTVRHVWRAGNLCRQRMILPGLVSCSKGMYIDDSYEGMIKNLRFLFVQWQAIGHNIAKVHDMITTRYGAASIPEDLQDFIELCNDLDDDK